MFCKQCGKENPNGSAFCLACGTPLEKMASGTPGKKNINIPAIASGALAILGVFLPYLSVSFMGFSDSLYLFGDNSYPFWGVMLLLASIVVCALAALKMNKGVLIAGGIDLLLFFITLIVIITDAGDAWPYANLSVGFYFMLLGILAAIASAVATIVMKKNNIYVKFM